MCLLPKDLALFCKAVLPLVATLTTLALHGIDTWPIFEIQTAREWDILPLESVHISFQLGSVTGNL